MQTLLDLLPESKDVRFHPEPPGSTFVLGLDLGQRRDHSALAIVERSVTATGERNPVTWQLLTSVERRLRHLSRWPLGTPYEQVAASVVARVARPPLAGNCILAIDATGVGDPVVESIRARRPQCRRLIPVVIAAAGHAHWLNSRLIVPRNALISNLQLVLEKRSLQASARTAGARLLESELSNYGQRGEHDDLVMATAIAVYLCGGASRAS